jgi:hypothetical protein
MIFDLFKGVLHTKLKISNSSRAREQKHYSNSRILENLSLSLSIPQNKKITKINNYTDCLCIFIRTILIVMDTKLTLKLNQEIIEKAKKYASDQKLSLSRIVENYLHSLTSDTKNDGFEISPFVKSISTGINMPSDFDYKKEYSDYLMEKYK